MAKEKSKKKSWLHRFLENTIGTEGTTYDKEAWEELQNAYGESALKQAVDAGKTTVNSAAAWIREYLGGSAKAESETSKKPTGMMPQKYRHGQSKNRGGLIRKGNNDMRKTGMFYK